MVSSLLLGQSTQLYSFLSSLCFFLLRMFLTLSLSISSSSHPNTFILFEHLEFQIQVNGFLWLDVVIVEVVKL
jgi:hypothetical protein